MLLVLLTVNDSTRLLPDPPGPNLILPQRVRGSGEALNLQPEVVHLLNLARQAEILPGYLGTIALTVFH